MDIVRGFIKISGITDVNDLFNLNNIYSAQFAEKDMIYLPEDSPGIDNIFEIILKAEILSCRFINTPTGTSIIFDGIKSLKIISTEINSDGKANFSYIKLPFNIFAKSPKVVGKMQDYDIYIMDAFFTLLDTKRIYSHITYLLHLNIDLPIKKPENEIEAIKKCSKQLTDKENRNDNKLEIAETRPIDIKNQSKTMPKEKNSDHATEVSYVELDAKYL